MKNKASVIDTKKIVIEIILIPLCILYLYYMLLYNHPKISAILLYIMITITCAATIICIGMLVASV